MIPFIACSFRLFASQKSTSLPEGGNETSLNPFMGSKYPMHGWQVNLKRTCAQPQGLGLRPKMKYPPLCGGMFIFVSDLH